MYNTYFKLKHASITVYSCKIDAFTIKAEDEKNPRELFSELLILSVRLDAGEWAMSKHADIELPNETIKL